jgi:hypothetical protein
MASGSFTQKKARRDNTGPVTIVVRTSALQGAVGPAIRTSASQEGSYTAQPDLPQGECGKKEKGPARLARAGPKSGRKPTDPGEDQDFRVYASCMPRGRTGKTQLAPCKYAALIGHQHWVGFQRGTFVPSGGL